MRGKECRDHGDGSAEHIGIGGIFGACGAEALAHPGSFAFSTSLFSPYGTVGATTYTLGSGTDWNWRFSWTTSAGGGGTFPSITSSAEEKANNAFNNARQSYYDFMGWANDWNNMIGDVSSAFKEYGAEDLQYYAKRISKMTGYFPYTLIGIRCVFNWNVREEDMLDLFETAGGDLGSYLGGRIIGTGFAAVTSECGPYTSAFAGAVGYAGGSVIGRGYGEDFGRDLFYNLAKPCYEAFMANKRMNEFVLDYNNYIYIHYPIVYPYPY